MTSAIELQSTSIPEDGLAAKANIKILILGASDSGKTTFGRQVRVLHGLPFSDSEKTHFKKIVRSICLEELSDILVEYIATQRVTTELTEKAIDFINGIRRGLVDRPTMDNAILIWNDMGVNFEVFQSLMKIHFTHNQHISGGNQKEFNSSILDNNTLQYQSDDPEYHFLPKFSQIMSSGYETTLDDILSIRVRTTGT